MKNVAKLTLFFTFSFISILVAASLLTLLGEWTGQALLFPPPSAETPGVFAGNAALHLERSLPAAFYLSILLGLSYAARRRMIYPAAFAVILTGAVVLSGASYRGLDSLKSGGFSLAVKIPARSGLVKPGFIVNAAPSGSFQTVFLADPYQDGAARAVALAGRPLSYQSQGAPPAQAPLPFGGKADPFFDGINRNWELSARIFSTWYKEGFLAYGIYAGSLAVFLLSLGCLVNISFWSLANLFFAALAFRGALALEYFLNQPNIHRLLASFAGNVIPESLINPLIFAALGILIMFYSILVYLARGISDG